MKSKIHEHTKIFKKIVNKKLIAFICCLFSSALCFAQDAEMADGMRSSGKIYVVIGVLLTILFGIIAFLIMIDKKVSDIEKRINKK